MNSSDAVASADRIHKDITTKPQLQCFNTSAFLAGFHTAKESVSALRDSPFGRKFEETQEIGQVKKVYDIHEFLVTAKDCSRPAKQTHVLLTCHSKSMCM